MTELDGLSFATPAERTQRLINTPEDQWFDRKSGRVAPKDLVKTVIAMANADGGFIAIGLHAGAPDTIDAASINGWRQTALDMARPAIRTELVELQGEFGGRPHKVVVVKVHRSEAVASTTSDVVYLRVGDEDRKLTFDQRRELVFDKGQTKFEETALPELVRDDLDPVAIGAYGKALDAKDPWRAAQARGLVDKDDRIRVAGVVAFAQQPDRWLPQHVVRVIKYADTHRLVGTRQNITADHRLSAPLSALIPSVRERIIEVLPTRRALTADGTFQTVGLIPEPVWLEAVVNAIIHRSYSNAGDHIRVEVFEDAIAVESPGRFPGVVDFSSPERIGRYARNPRIARVASDLRFGQELGEGMRRMFQEMSLAGLVEPAFHQTSGSVQVVLSGRPIDAHLESRLPDRARAILVIVREQDHPSTGDIIRSTGLSRPVVSRTLQALAGEKLIERIGTSPKDPRAYWRLRGDH